MLRLVERFQRSLRRLLQPVVASATQQSESGLPPTARADDVANCYRLILGRRAESDTVIAEKVGMELAALLGAFLSSDEFDLDTRPFLEGSKPVNLFAEDVTNDLRSWVRERIFGDGEPTDEAFAEIQDVAPLLGYCLTRAPLAEIAATRLGRDNVAALAIHASKRGKPRLRASTTREDMHNCYVLFLHRAPESESVIKPRPHTPLAESVCDFMTSPEFAARIAFPAMDGRSVQTQATAELRKWAASALRIDDAKSRPGESLVAAALEQPAIAYALSRRTIAWDAQEVVRGLDSAAGITHRRPSTIQGRLKQVAHNFSVLACHHMRLTHGKHLIRFAGSDPWILLKPDPAVTGSELLSLRFRVTVDGLPTSGMLYLDYGAGCTESNTIPLSPDSEGFHHAVVFAPGRLAAIRWDPAAMRGLASISLMKAEPLSLQDYCAERFGEAGDETILQRLVAEAERSPEQPLAVVISRMLSPPGDSSSYAKWISRNEPHGPQGAWWLSKRYDELKHRPLISVVVPVYNTPPHALADMIASVQKQAYKNWELCLANDASTQLHVAPMIDRAALDDERIKVVHLERNGHICAASNSALKLASGDWIAMLDHDDLLAPQALLAVAEYIETHPSVGLVYSDEDKLDDSGQRYDPYFKPDYSPELLLAQNYINHLTVMRTDLVRDAGGWREGFEGSQDHDLVLRIVEKLTPSQVGHVPEILYHWRAVAGSTALSNDEKSYALRAGEEAVRDHLRRRGARAEVELIKGVHHYRVRHQLPDEQPLISLIIPTRDKADILKVAINSILDRSTYERYEILVIDNDSVEQRTKDYFADITNNPKIKVISYPHAFNYSKINNFGVKHSKGTIVGLINNDIEVITPGWMEEMASWAIQEKIGCVGAKLYYPDMSIQHAGVILGLGGCAGHSHKYFPREAPGYFYRLQVHQNLSAVTAACLFIRRKVFDEVGGLDEKLAVAFNDVDFCLRVREAGYRNLFTPFAELIHHESISRGLEDTAEKMARAAGEVNFMQERWKDNLRKDPYYSPHLTSDREDFSLNI